jgi:hypothetical protein
LAGSFFIEFEIGRDCHQRIDRGRRAHIEPAHPTADTMTAYRHGRDLAEQYWELLSSDTRVSADFRAIAKTCGETLAPLPRTGAYAYTDDEARDTRQ